MSDDVFETWAWRCPACLEQEAGYPSRADADQRLMEHLVDYHD